jgi:chromosome segregation protein
MRIKKLEVSGFKSFAQRARLHFGDGITGVVGPNGCGKSNVVDAIRWCMGEMSAKHLRGRAMQDVIFAGSDSHGPQGMAEVTLTFDNSAAVAAGVAQRAAQKVAQREAAEAQQHVAARLAEAGRADGEGEGAAAALGDGAAVAAGGESGDVSAAAASDESGDVSAAAAGGESGDVSATAAGGESGDVSTAAASDESGDVSAAATSNKSGEGSASTASDESGNDSAAAASHKLGDGTAAAANDELADGASAAAGAGSNEAAPAGADNAAESALGADPSDVTILARNAAQAALEEAQPTTDGFHGPHQFLNYAEISVTRRLYRDGTSEYLLNKVPVRLRDVTDLFLGTGVGTRAYSIIEQGRIGFIVNSRPEDRRSLIEEVAGITKFKSRKKVAERRMESTEQNLLRVDDIVNELQRQLATLERQAKKALRYKELRQEQRDLELHAASMEILRLAASERVQRTLLDSCQANMTESQKAVASQEQVLSREREALTQAQKVLQADQATSHETDAQLQALQSDIAHWEEQLAQSAARGNDATAEVAHCKDRLQQVQQEQQALQEQDRALQAQAGADQEALQEATQAAQDARTALREVDDRLEALRRQAMQQVHGAAKERTLANSLQRQRTDLLRACEQDELRREPLQLQCSEMEGQRETLLARRDTLQENLAAAKSGLESGRAALQQNKQQAKQSAEQVAACHQDLAQRQSRLGSLQQIAQRLDGYSDGVRTLMGRKAPKELRLGHLVAEVLEVPPQHEGAIEAVLGDRLQYILVEAHATAQAAIAYLQAQKGGRSGFVLRCDLPATAARKQSSLQALPLPALDGVLGPALEHVEVAEEHRDLATALLGNVLLVDTLATALEVHAEASTAAWVCVTAAGEVLDAAGSLTGGCQSGAGMLAHRREIRELQQQVERLGETHATLQREHAALAAEVVAQEQKLAQDDRDARALELECLGVGKDCQSVERESQRMAAQLKGLAQQVERQKATLERLENDTQAALKKACAAESGHQEAEDALQALADGRTAQAQELGVRQEGVTQLKVRIASEAQRASAAQAALQRVAQSLADLQQRQAQSQSQAQEMAAAVSRLNEKLEEGRAQQDTLAEASIVAQGRLAGQSEALEAQEAAQSSREAELKVFRQGADVLHEQILAATMEQQKLLLARQTLCTQVLERHDVNLLWEVSAYHMRPLPTAAQKSRLESLDKTLRSMGSINLTAIDECREVQTRHAFLTAQRDDLNRAIETLRAAIQKINRASRERFAEAFEAVNTMFQKVYPRLFRGGSARLELVESADLLEAGVDIVAMPPGKKLQNVGLLSGGEKALTATALIFSIFLIKPSPFCILDEVDAPLDEANVGRFNDMLREISAVSQFIVITHNKQTMLQADRLYGITMEEPGMSKVVSVDLDQQSAQAAA